MGLLYYKFTINAQKNIYLVLYSLTLQVNRGREKAEGLGNKFLPYITAQISVSIYWVLRFCSWMSKCSCTICLPLHSNSSFPGLFLFKVTDHLCPWPLWNLRYDISLEEAEKLHHPACSRKFKRCLGKSVLPLCITIDLFPSVSPFLWQISCAAFWQGSFRVWEPITDFCLFCPDSRDTGGVTIFYTHQLHTLGVLDALHPSRLWSDDINEVHQRNQNW